ncbi:MAG: molybdenum cofactor guanylyltransferase [Ignavibacteriales bacterium]|nr:molybdenum cofactor guanylyltransferase [Ignavibacteriales bacterium]
MNNTTIGVILAGGKSLRMGRDKALLKFDGRPFVSHVATTVQEVFDRVILVANDPSAYGFLGLETIEDIYRECGPLGGIHSALVHAGSADIFVSACDTPFVTRDLFRYIVGFDSHASARIPSFKQQLHPLCGIYTQKCLPAIAERLESCQLRVVDFVESIHAAVIPISPDLPFYREDLFANFNTPEDHSRNKNDL